MSTDELVFIHGPRLAAAGTAADRRRIRSELMRRLYMERQLQRELTGAQEPAKIYQPAEGRDFCPGCGSKATKDGEPGAVCGQCGMPIKDKKQRGKGRKREARESKNKNTEIVPSSPSRLGSGRIDPFTTIPNTGGMRTVDELIDHCIKKQMPSMRRVTTWSQKFYEGYLKGAWSPLLFHASCLAISVHLELTARHHRMPDYHGRALEQLYHKGAALKALQKSLSRPLVFGTTAVAEMILCICFLAIHDDVESSVQKDYNPFNPPFQGLQALDFYGCRAFNPHHLEALLQLVRQNGGFETIKYYGAPWFLSYTSLKHAMATSTRPTFPISDPSGKQYGDTPPLRILKVSEAPFHKTFNRGFHQLKALQIKDYIIKTLVHMGELAQCMQVYIPRENDADAMDLLGDARNTIQYRVLYLPKPSDALDRIFDGTPHVSAVDVYRACWLATSIFSMHVTFPIPRPLSARERFLPLLQDAISKIDPLVGETYVSEILLWCTMTGGIAAEDAHPGYREWYAVQLKRLCLVLNIDDWNKMRGLMRSFAWLDSGCDAAGYRLWMETHAPC